MKFSEYKRQFFQQWHRRILILCWTLWLITLILELSVGFVFGDKLTTYIPSLPEYLKKRVLLPSGINLLTVIAYTVIYKNPRIPQRIENWVCTISFFILSVCIASAHSYFQPLLFIPCIPIFLSAIFTDIVLTNTMGILELIASAPTFHFWSQNFDENTKSAILVSTMIIYVAVLLYSYLFSRFIMRMQIDQLDYIKNAYYTQEELIDELNIEPMTGLSNRTAMDKCTDLYIQKFHAGEFVPHLALLDIDHFKNVNDTYGHNAGDIAIKTLASIIKKHMGGVRRAFRFGGDEMVLIFNRESKEEIGKILDAIRNDFRNCEFAFKPASPITISVGVSAFYKGLNKKTWFELTDEIMYKSKENGRDQVTYSG